MDNQSSPVLTWAYFLQGKNIDELRHSLLCTTVELEQTRIAVQEELRKKDDQLIHLKDLLTLAIRERDEANEKCQKLLFEKLFFQQQQLQAEAAAAAAAPVSGISSIEDEPRRGIESQNGFSSSDCEESIVSSPVLDPIPHPPQMQQPPPEMVELVPDKPLPEKGKLLQAVMKAGPLLQTLLLAGPLPQWRHPPPPLESFQIPPVTIPLPPPPPPPAAQDSLANMTNHHTTTINTTNCGIIINKKRAFCEDSESPTSTKYQRLVFH